MQEVPWEMIIDKLEKVGLEVTEGAKTGIEFMWPLAVRQTIVVGILNFLFGIALIYIAYKLGKFSMETKEEYEKTRFGKVCRYDVFQTIGWSISGLSIICSPFLIYSGLIRLLNPKWYAVQHLIELLE